ncbi:hypothetical protein [Streptosporangium sp. LJ11]|uniref:hypothetical protein n=1 Tax=Streptosporangium sp. LJ11 TaxID=3436927 RepID=UPI003F79A03B
MAPVAGDLRLVQGEGQPVALAREFGFHLGADGGDLVGLLALVASLLGDLLGQGRRFGGGRGDAGVQGVVAEQAVRAIGAGDLLQRHAGPRHELGGLGLDSDQFAGLRHDLGGLGFDGGQFAGPYGGDRFGLGGEEGVGAVALQGGGVGVQRAGTCTSSARPTLPGCPH